MSYEGAAGGVVVAKLPAIAVGASVEIFGDYGHENSSCTNLSPLLA
jgi:hypothetical protein